MATQWYMAKLVHQFVCGNGQHLPQFNEQLRLVAAEDALHAFYKARLIGERESIDLVEKGVAISWKFIDVTDVLPINHLADGAELWANTTQDSDAELYIRNTRRRAAQLMDNGVEALAE